MVHCHLYSGLVAFITQEQTYARTGYRSSGLATKQLSAVVASGASTGKAEEGNTLISSTIPDCCVFSCLRVFLDFFFPFGIVTRMSKHPTNSNFIGDTCLTCST